MKKLIFLLLPLIALTTSAQVIQQKTFCIQASCAQTISVGDSAVIQAQLTASDGVSYVTWSTDSTVKQALPTPIVDYSTTVAPYASMVSTIILKNLPAGKYTFTATGGSLTRISGFANTTLTVLPKVACPVIPPQRVATAIQISINGQLITIPLIGTKITYSDGSTQ